MCVHYLAPYLSLSDCIFLALPTKLGSVFMLLAIYEGAVEGEDEVLIGSKNHGALLFLDYRNGLFFLLLPLSRSCLAASTEA